MDQTSFVLFEKTEGQSSGTDIFFSFFMSKMTNPQFLQIARMTSRRYFNFTLHAFKIYTIYQVEMSKAGYDLFVDNK